MKSLVRCLAPMIVLMGATLVGCKGQVAQPTRPDSPKATVEQAYTAMAKGQPQDLWVLLPPDYQKDVNELAREAAGKLDPDLYNATQNLLSKGLSVLDKQKDFILENEVVSSGLQEGPVTIEEVRANYTKLVDLLKTLINDPQLDTHESFAKIDVGKFVETTLAQVMQQGIALADTMELQGQLPPSELFEQVKQAKFTEISNDGQKAVVEVAIPDQPPHKIDLVKVDGHWLPTEMHDEWQSTMAGARQELAAIPEIDPELKQKLLSFADTLDGVLDDLNAASSQEEFNNEVGSAMGRVIVAFTPLMGEFGFGGMGGGGFGPPPGDNGFGPPNGFDQPGFDQPDLPEPDFESEQLPN